MKPANLTVVGIDVGGEAKGFNAVALRGEAFVGKIQATDPVTIAAWCLSQGARVVAVDAPCGWSQSGSSRLAERDLFLFSTKIHCFATPIRDHALSHEKHFYAWMLNGERLYQHLGKHYPLFKGQPGPGPLCFETFPHAITCVLEGKVVTATKKLSLRRQTLQKRGYEISQLSNIDFVDAALCAVAAKEFTQDNFRCFGGPEEGIIVLPHQMADTILANITDQL